MKKLVRSRAGRSSPRPSISIRVRPIEMSKWPASSNTVQCGRSGSTGTSRVDAAHSGSVRPRKVASIRASSSASVSMVVSYEPMPTFYHQGGGVRQGFTAPTSLVRAPAGLRRDGGRRRTRGASLVRGRLRGDGRVHGVVRPGPDRIWGTGRRPGPDRTGAHPPDPAAGGRPGGDRRPLRRDRGGPGRLLARGLRQLRPGYRDRRPVVELPGSGPRPRAGVRGRPAGRRIPGRPGALTVGYGEAEDLLRQLAPQVLGALVRRYGHFDTAEDAVQEALLAAATQWPEEGLPGNPRGWLITVASRRLTDLLRSEQSRRAREEAAARRIPPGEWLAPAADVAAADSDDTLILLFLCCHPALSPAAQIALTLRAVGGLTTAEVARAFLVPEATMTRRITRAKVQVADSGVPFRMPNGPEHEQRLTVVLHVLYLIFTEGYAATSGPGLFRADLSAEAIRLARIVRRLLPGDGEVAGLLALMLLTDARRPARTGPAGELIPLDEQDRSRWDQAKIAEGVALVTAALPRGDVGPYQLQAAIAAVHDEAASAGATDWPQILALYDLLLRISDNPVVALNHAVAVAMTHGPGAGLERLGRLETDRRIAGDHRLEAVRAHLLEMGGQHQAARAAYQAAAQRTMSLPHQRYLNARAARLSG